jgi:hypothetical protein
VLQHAAKLERRVLSDFRWFGGDGQIWLLSDVDGGCEWDGCLADPHQMFERRVPDQALAAS